MSGRTHAEIRAALDGRMSDYEAADVLGDAYRALRAENDRLREQIAGLTAALRDEAPLDSAPAPTGADDEKVA